MGQLPSRVMMILDTPFGCRFEGPFHTIKYADVEPVQAVVDWLEAHDA